MSLFQRNAGEWDRYWHITEKLPSLSTRPRSKIRALRSLKKSVHPQNRPPGRNECHRDFRQPYRGQPTSPPQVTEQFRVDSHLSSIHTPRAVVQSLRPEHISLPL